MKRTVSILCLVLALLLAAGCAGAPADVPEAEAVAEAEPADVPAAKAEPDAAPAATPEPTAEPTPTPAPTEEPTYPAPDPIPADGFAAQTAEAAVAEIQLYLMTALCYTSAEYDTGTYDSFCSYDAAHDAVCLTLTPYVCDALVSAVLPLYAAGKLSTLMLNTDEGSWPGVPLTGVKTLIVTRYDGAGALRNSPDITSLTIGTLDADGFADVPPALTSLTIETTEDNKFDLSSLGTAFPVLKALTVGQKGEKETISLSGNPELFPTQLGSLQTVNLWTELHKDVSPLFSAVLELPALTSFNGRDKDAYGPYVGLGYAFAIDAVARQVEKLKKEGTALPAVKGLPKSISGHVSVEIGEETENNLAYEYVKYSTGGGGDEPYYGIPPKLQWQAGREEEQAESDGWLAYIYEFDKIVGYYGDKEDEIWGYAAETRLVLVQIGTGKAWQTTIATKQPPQTDATGRIGKYCPLLAVEKVRELLPDKYGAYAGCLSEIAQEYVVNAISMGDSCYATEGLPKSLPGQIHVHLNTGAGMIPDNQYIDDSHSADMADGYYNFPAGRVCDGDASADTAWYAIICERDRQTSADSDRYDVETHLVIIEAATGRAWHKLIATSPASQDGENGAYGSFYPAKALEQIRKLLG